MGLLLAIDVGNTNVMFALVRGRDVLHRWRIATNARRTSDEYKVWLNQLFELHELGPAEVTSAIVASVVPQAMFDIERLVREFFEVEPMIVGAPEVALGMEVLLPNPAEVGADRVVNAVAAREAHGAPLIVVDFGTATTFDVVDARGAYVGGVICPGINLSMEALFTAAAKLPRVAVEPPPPGEPVIGRSTVHAMRSGVFWGYVGLIDGLAQRIKSEVEGPARVIATGGLAPLFERHSAAIDLVDPDLTIRGLVLIHERNFPPQ